MLFIAGPHAAGKTSCASILREQGFSSIDLGPTLRSIHQRQAPNLSLGEFIENGVRDNGSYFTDNLLAREINTLLNQIPETGRFRELLVLGNRSNEGICYLKKNVTTFNGGISPIIYIDGKESELYKRYCAREGINISTEEFRNLLESDKRMGIEEIRDKADFIIFNDEGEETFKFQIEHVVFGLLGYERMR